VTGEDGKPVELATRCLKVVFVIISRLLFHGGLTRGEGTKRNLKLVGYLFSLVKARRKLLT
jgi:hypothetical protein